MPKRTAIALCFLLSLVCANAQTELRIGILRDMHVGKAIFIVEKAKYMLYCDGRAVAELLPNEGVRVEVVPGGLSVKTLTSTFPCKQQVRLAPQHSLSAFRMRALDHQMVEKKFTDELVVERRNGKLQMVNVADVEQYVAGVVESEAGIKQTREYYKLQAIICRTYALSNLRRHEGEGFHLCDQVHCQVYKSKNMYNDTIFRAVWATRGMVIVDPEINLITATFHSNCGGETVNAEDVWSKPLPYLRSVCDTFCTASTHASWTKEITKDKWSGYMKRKYNYPASASINSGAGPQHLPSDRQVFFAEENHKIPVEDMRHDLGLNSTHFFVKPEGDKVVLEGRGYGHGVGVCQEGAMYMARLGMGYMDILHHYYTDVHLVDLSVIQFFQE